MMKKPVNGAITNGAILLKKNTMKQPLLMELTQPMMLIMVKMKKMKIMMRKI
jgi:hypothetical protein